MLLAVLSLGAAATLANAAGPVVHHHRHHLVRATIGAPATAGAHIGVKRHRHHAHGLKHAPLKGPQAPATQPAPSAAATSTPATNPAPAQPAAGPPCPNNCSASVDNSQCHDHCQGAGDANCHDHCYGDGDTNCHDHCYGNGDENCHDHCFGTGDSQCQDSCTSSDNSNGAPNPSPSPPPSPTPAPSPSPPATSTPAATPTVTPTQQRTSSIHISRPALGPDTSYVGPVPGSATGELFEAGAAGQSGSATGTQLPRTLARGTSRVRAGAGVRQAVKGVHLSRRRFAGASAAATAAGAAGATTVIQRFITSIPTGIWLALAALLLLTTAAAVAAWRSSQHARQNAAVAAEVSAAALTDALTGILNRRGFVQAFKRELDRAQRYGRPLALAFVDVRGLKAVNDSHGHRAGDRLLQDVASMLGESARAHDIVGRIGGDELALLLPEQSADGVARVVHRVRDQVTTRRRALGFSTAWDLTVGVALFPEDGEDVDDLLEAADRRLYQQRGIEIR